MNRDDIIRIAREAGLHLATDVNWMPIIGLEYAEKFAALVIANQPPQSSMAWQEGYEAGVITEREAWVKVCEPQEGWGNQLTAHIIATAIRERGKE